VAEVIDRNGAVLRSLSAGHPRNMPIFKPEHIDRDRGSLAAAPSGFPHLEQPKPSPVGIEPGQPALGRAAHSRRTAQARHIDVRQTSVAKYMARRRGGPSQGLRTFLCNHADGIVSMDLLVVPTLSFRLLYGFLVLRDHRRRIMWLGVTANPTAERIARQVTEACGWEAAPDYIVRDCDCAYGEVFIRRLRAMGIRDRPTAL
jgi:hypothetical protein